MVNEQQNEDCDISNRAINEYLNNIDILTIENLRNELTAINQNALNENQREDFKETSLIAFRKRSFIFKFVKQKIVLESIQKLFKIFDDILFDFDKQQVKETLLENLNNISKNSFFLKKKFFSYIFFLSILFLFLSFFYLTFFTILFIAIICILLFFWLEFFTKIAETLFLYIYLISEKYVKSNQKLIYFLKEVELVSLTNLRQHFVNKNRIKNESKRNLDQIESDSLNYKYRRQAFILLKKHFFELRDANLIYLSEIKSINVETENLLSMIKPEELSNILISDDNDLDRLSDHFSIYCLKSINKFNSLLISESIKLLFIAYIDIFINSEFFLIKSYKFLKNLLNVYFFMNKLTIQLDELTKFSKLGKDTDKNESFYKDMNSHKSEYKLQLHTRHFLLILLEFSRLNSVTEKLNQLSLLKSNFENCKFYFNLVLKDFESQINSQEDQEENDKSEIDLKKLYSTEKPIHLISDNDQEVIDDEILEADTSLFLKDENLHEIGQKNELDYFKQKELHLLNKNLFYELKYALKSKRNEWINREKIAKQKFDSKDTEAKENHQSYHLIQMKHEYLLENDILKYKSSIRKRFRVNKVNTEEKKDNSKYFYQPKMNGIIPQSFLPIQDGFLSELIEKHSKLQENKLETLFETDN